MDTKETFEKRASWYKLFKFASCGDIVLLILGILFSIIDGCLFVLAFYQFKYVIQYLYESEDNKGNFDSDAYYDYMIGVIEFMSALAAVSILTGYLATLLLTKVAIRQGNAWRQAYFRSLMTKSQDWYDKRNIYELPAQLHQDWLKIEEACGNKVILFFHILGALVFAIAIAMAHHVQLSLYTLLQLPVVLVGVAFIGYALTFEEDALSQAYTSAQGIAGECIEHIKTVESNNMQDFCVDKYKTSLQQSTKVQRKMGIIFGIGTGIAFGTWMMGLAFCSWMGSRFYGDGSESWAGDREFQIEDTYLIFFMIGIACQAVGQGIPAIEGILSAQYSLQRIIDIINSDQAQTKDASEKKSIKSGSIVFKNVSFSYPSQPYVSVLNQVSFSVTHGQRIALVGESGCGKSTIIKLIERIYDNYTGEIFLNDSELRTIDREYLRSQIGLVSQDAFLFNTSLYDNILYGNLSATKEEVVYAAMAANIHDFIQSLPKGYDTIAGSKGCKISGGQKQRIWIARAILRNPKILLLDEATSSLDKINESQIMSNLWQLSSNYTTIIISQCLSTIQKADKIFVLSQGEIAESGTHDELMQQNGIYNSLVSRQEETQIEQGTDYDVRSLATAYTTKSAIQDKNYLDLEEGYEIEEHYQGSFWLRVTKASSKQAPWLILALIFALIVGVNYPLFGFYTAESACYFLEEQGETLKEKVAKVWVIIAIIAGWNAVALCFKGACESQSGSSFTEWMRISSFRAILNFDCAFFDMTDKGRISAALANDTAILHKLVGPILTVIMTFIGGIVTGLIIGYFYNWRIVFVSIALSPCLGYGLTRGDQYRLAGLGIWKYSDNIASDCIVNISTVRAYCLEHHLESIYVNQHQQMQRGSNLNRHKEALDYGFCMFLCFVFITGSMWYMSFDQKTHKGDPMDNLRAYMASIMIGFGMQIAVSFSPNLDEAKQAAKRLFSLIDYQSNIDTSENRLIPNWESASSVEFRNIYFQYPNIDAQVLRDISFTVEKGTFFSITGFSGSGKSTLMQLIVRLYDPTAGEVLLDGENVSQFNLKNLRDLVVHLGQDTILFSGSIEENLTLGKAVEPAILQNAIAQSQASDFVDAYGLERDVGTSGDQLSGGQKQRLAIARALLRTPQILLLDESTSALDSHNEAEVLQSLRSLTPGITIISVSHRPSSLGVSDAIAVLDQGQVVEIGTPEELIEKQGHYYKIINSNN